MNIMPLLLAQPGRLPNRSRGPHAAAYPKGLRSVILAMATAALTWCSQGAMAQSIASGKTASVAEIMYLVLLGEMQVAAQEPGLGYSLLLEAARKSADPDVYRRAVNVALESRSGDAAKEAARAWANALPTSADPYRVLLQLMLANNEVVQSATSLEKLLAVVPDAERNALIDVIGQAYARVKDKVAARQVAVTALQPWTQRPDTAASAWAAQGVLALNLGQKDSALALLREAITSTGGTGAPGLLALALMNAKLTEAETMLDAYLANTAKVLLPVRMAHVRYLLDNNRLADAQRHLEATAALDPASAEPWLLLGALNLQQGLLDTAEEQLKRFLVLSENGGPERTQRSHTQAYLALAQIAEARQQFDAAQGWLDRIEPADDELRVQLRRAALLAKQGKLGEARALIQKTPALQPADARIKLLAEVQLLKDAQKLTDAYAVMEQAATLFPEDEELAYEHAMLADKLGQFHEMERILRALIERKPNYHHAHNALGYALADRNTRLDEAKALILKALEMAPGDPFITDSLGWVEYRLGNLPMAVQLLQQAFEKRADIEIAVHLGEVLWAMGDREAAKAMFQQAKGMQADNAALVETLKRLGVSR